jgi:hypothetical protein
MKRKRPAASGLPMEQSDLAVNFYDVACDHPNESFVQITKRVIPRKLNEASAAFKQEARRMFNLGR